MELHSINEPARLYVMPCGGGFSCYGFDVLDRKARAVAAWAKVAPPLATIGTRGHFEQCAAILDHGARYAAETGTRCDAELTRELIGLERRRVEVTEPDGTRRRFWIGKSTGWIPCHLEIKTTRSTGGGRVYFPAGSRVRVIGSECR